MAQRPVIQPPRGTSASLVGALWRSRLARLLVPVAILAALWVSAAPGSATTPLRPAAAATVRIVQRHAVSTKVSRPITATGVYRVVISVRARRRAERVWVYLSGQARRKVRALPRKAETLSYRLTLDSKLKRLIARAVSPRPRVHLAMTVALVAGGHPSSSSFTAPTGSTSPGSGGSGGSGGGGPTGPSGSTGPTGPPQFPNPYNHMTFDDEFGGSAGSGFVGSTGASSTDSQWTVETGGGECGSDTLNTNTTSIANAQENGQGDLVITATDNNGTYTSAQMHTTFTQQYGAFEARIWLARGEGLCPAFWSIGQPGTYVCTPGPQCGEIDILEAPAFSSTPNFAIFTLHGPMTCDTCNYQQWETNTTALGDLSAGWHTYGIVWSPGSITWTIDGVAYATATPASVDPRSTWIFGSSTNPDPHGFDLVLDLAVGGWACNQNANPSPTAGCPDTSAFPAKMLVDWVRTYD